MTMSTTAAPEDLQDQDAPHRRREDTIASQVGKVVLWLVYSVAAAGAGGWYAKNTTGIQQAAQLEVIDAKAREQILLLKVELNGKLDLINQKQDQISEQIRELKGHAR